ncbi:MAG: glycosyltransferase [Parvibaculaceae bacterium]
MRNLLFTSAGDRNSISQWLGRGRQYELAICYYGDKDFPHESEADISFRRKGSKFQNLKYLHSKDPSYLDGFSSVLVIDDDIEISKESINQLFKVRDEYELDLLQPAFLSSGRVDHLPLTRLDGCFGRFVNFVEVSCPLFGARSLVRFLDVYDGSLVGWGIDHWYSSFLRDRGLDRIAVIDRVPCRNPHAFEKGDTVREIDRLQPAKERRAAWNIKSAELGLSADEKVRVLGELVEWTRADEKPGPTRICIVVGWENAARSRQDGIPLLFSVLSKDAESLGEPIEILVLFDPEQADREELHSLIASHVHTEPGRVSVEVHGVADKRYYDLKNAGAVKSRGDIIVFADSDIVPEPGWLRALVGHLDENPDVGLVAGYSYISPTGFIDRAFAAGRFFPLRADCTETSEPADFLFADNCAYRRNVFLAHPFRVETNSRTRAACRRQLHELRKGGIRTVNSARALASRPAPKVFRNIVVGALAEGRDHVLEPIKRNKRVSVFQFLEMPFRGIGKTIRTVASDESRQKIKSNVIEAPAIVLFVIAYYIIYVCGGVAAFISPSFVKNRWRI